MYYVYILRSLKDLGFYIGCTSDLEKRLKEHNSGTTPSLKKRLPLEVFYKEEFTDRKLAFRRERQIKKYKGGEAFKKLINFDT